MPLSLGTALICSLGSLLCRKHTLFFFFPSKAQTRQKTIASCLIETTCLVGNEAKLWSPHCHSEDLWFPFLWVNKSRGLREGALIVDRMFIVSKEGKVPFTELCSLCALGGGVLPHHLRGLCWRREVNHKIFRLLISGILEFLCWSSSNEPD